MFLKAHTHISKDFTMPECTKAHLRQSTISIFPGKTVTGEGKRGVKGRKKEKEREWNGGEEALPKQTRAAD